MFSLQTLYSDLLNHTGRYESESRNGRTIGKFGMSWSHDLLFGFPLLTLRKLKFNTILQEALWYIRGDDHVRTLNANGCHIWDKWADSKGNLGPVYGKQWRDWEGIDQLKQVEYQLKNEPSSRRMLVNAWNVYDLPRMALPPCPFAFQLHAHVEVGRPMISMTVYQRSADVIIGVPHDMAVHAILLKMFALISGRSARKLTLHFGDAHYYVQHKQAMDLLLQRQHRGLPMLHIKALGQESLADFKAEDIHITNYHPHDRIKLEVC